MINPIGSNPAQFNFLTQNPGTALRSGAASQAASTTTGYTPASQALPGTTSGPNNTDLMSMPHQQSGELSQASQSGDQPPEIANLLEQLIQLLTQLLQQLKSGGAGSGSAQGAITPDGGGELQPESGTGGDSNIPKPTEHIQTINLGGKQVTIGGDGTASAAEVQQTANTMRQMYQTSPTFRNQIDSNPNSSLEVSVGRRSDNTSWGSSDGRIFMNINNVQPTSNDTFQSLLAHEVAHTQGLDHGSQMEGIEDAVAAEA